MEDGDGCGLTGDCATRAAFASGLVRFTVVLTDVSDVGVSFDIVVKIDLNSFDSRLPWSLALEENASLEAPCLGLRVGREG